MIAAEELSDERLPRWQAWVLIAALSLALWTIIVAVALEIAR